MCLAICTWVCAVCCSFFSSHIKIFDSPIFFSVIAAVVFIVPSPRRPTEYGHIDTKCTDNSPYLINFIYDEGKKPARVRSPLVFGNCWLFHSTNNCKFRKNEINTMQHQIKCIVRHGWIAGSIQFSSYCKQKGQACLIRKFISFDERKNK